jgi:hypothetical protein
MEYVGEDTKEILLVEIQWTSLLVVDWLLIMVVSICLFPWKNDVADIRWGWFSSSSDQSAGFPKCLQFL